jgi:hypothetical protein
MGGRKMVWIDRGRDEWVGVRLERRLLVYLMRWGPSSSCRVLVWRYSRGIQRLNRIGVMLCADSRNSGLLQTEKSLSAGTETTRTCIPRVHSQIFWRRTYSMSARGYTVTLCRADSRKAMNTVGRVDHTALTMNVSYIIST